MFLVRDLGQTRVPCFLPARASMVHFLSKVFHGAEHFLTVSCFASYEFFVSHEVVKIFPFSRIFIFLAAGSTVHLSRGSR